MDFVKIMERSIRGGGIEIYPSFMVSRSKDLMVRGKAFYAIWDESKGLWSTDEYDVQRLVDEELWHYKDILLAQRAPNGPVIVKTMQDYSNGCWSTFKNYLKNVSDNNHTLDEKLTFSNTEVTKEDYVSKRLAYPLVDTSYSSYDEIMSTLYDKDERAKLEWAIGSIVSGDSRYIQKFIVLYGEAGAGKSTVLNIIQQLFDGYYTMFDAKALVGSNNSFSTEVFRANPLVAIQHDGDLSKIEDNTKLNSIVSHEEMTMNEKFKSSYTARTNCFLFMATNRPVKITDAKSGIIRRLIDVKPSGRRLPPKRYQILMDQIPFELGGIAKHCLDIYKSMGKNYYSDYRPLDMIYQTDVFFNFVESCYDDFLRTDGVTLTRAYDMYKAYCEDSLVDFKLARHKFREELKNYFEHFDLVTRVGDKQIRSYYSGFLVKKFESIKGTDAPKTENDIPKWLQLKAQKSIFDQTCAGCKAQYATSAETPISKWEDVTTALSDVDTSKLHYILVPLNHIVIDFDLKDETGAKSRALNISAASSWPETYSELSKGGQGLHLHYIYEGDVSRLKRLYSEGIEVKIFTGNSSLRRRLSECNDIPIATISGGLPLKEEKTVVDQKVMKSEKALRQGIEGNLHKKYHPGTKPSMDFIKKMLDDAYSSGMVYDVSDMEPRIFSFACHSTNHADYCIKLMDSMKFKSESESKPQDEEDQRLVFFDVEVFPNLFLVNYKTEGTDSCVRMINPTPEDISDLMKHRLVGFNCRRYDNHILYGRYLGYSNLELYDLSQRIVSGNAKAMFHEAYDISYTDVYDFSSKKQSLKKFEIELGIHHQELGLPWDQPVPEEMWPKVAEYCDNDVIATEAVFNARKADWTARQILADVADLSVNDTTNTLTTRIIFGSDKNPQGEFNYRFMGDIQNAENLQFGIPDLDTDKEFTVFEDGKPIFPGYLFDCGKSLYRGEEVGEGGYVYAEPGIYHNVALLDIASMHPSSIVAEQLFGSKYTARFKEILDARISIKHGDYETAKTLLDGKLAKYLEDKSTAKQLAQALKIAINSVYGLTSARFDNPFKDIRNKDNIVAKRGALFMVNLKHEVQSRGYTVAHIKTDSIKIPNADPDIIKFVQDYGRAYGYNFEHEATYDRMCLVNDAVYIAKFSTESYCMNRYGYCPKECLDSEEGGKWTATGAQFAQPYLFKTLFSHEPVEFEDMCEAKSVSTSIYIDFNENLGEDQHDYHFVGKTGLFCPIKPGCGGGELFREKDGKYYSVGGTKGYRWMESEMVRTNHYEDFIDRSYYDKMVDEAVKDISKYGDITIFLDEETSGEDWEPPFDICEDAISDCGNCPHACNGECITIDIGGGTMHDCGNCPHACNGECINIKED